MLINKTEEKHVKFISYTGDFPNLCSGILTLEIDGEQYKFGHSIYNEPQGQFPKFWCSGGSVWFDDEWREHVESGEWRIDVDDLPEQFRKYAAEIDEVFNENVEYGCCGGCV
jgi:hypothetical protein